VDRPGLLPGEVEALEQPEHAGFAVADAEATLDHIAQVAGTPGDAAGVPSRAQPGLGWAAVALKLGALEDQRLERGLLAFVQGAGAAGTGPIAQALDTLLVVAVDPVPERLPGHPGEPCRFLTGQAVQRVGERQQPGAEPTVTLAAGEPAQFGRVALGADRQRCGHGGISERMPPEHLSRAVDPSPFHWVGMILKAVSLMPSGVKMCSRK